MSNRLIFMGTPDFAVPSLIHLAQHYQVIAVVTQPDRQSGRGRKVSISPVKQAALDLGLPVIQPPTLRDTEAVAELVQLKPDLIVVAAFGQILRQNVLNLPPHGCVNVHASLLPRWRGAAPVAAAIRAGDSETGVTLMQMDRGLDTGAIIRAKSIPIEPHHTRANLTEILAELGAKLLIETLPDWFAGNIEPQPQNDAEATFARLIQKEEGLIDWHQSAQEIERHIRAFDPWPGTYTFWQRSRLKIISATVFQGADKPDVEPGVIFEVNRNVVVKTGRGLLALNQIQVAGKRAMSAIDLAHGNADFVGSQLQAA